MKLQEAYADHDEGKITWEQLQAAQDDAAADSIRRLEATGEPIVTDGEQRESSFATYPLTHTLAGTGLGPNLAGDGQFFAIFDDGHHRQLPRLTGGPFRYQTYASEFVKKNKAIATHQVKQAVIAPSMLMLLYPLNDEIPGYSREQFLSDLVDECEKDIRQCFDAGAVRVSIDFTEGRLANKNDSRNPWTGKNMLQDFIDLNNRVLDRFTPAERKNIGIHTCPGGDCDSVHSKEVPYELLLSHMFDINAGYFLSNARARTTAKRSTGCAASTAAKMPTASRRSASWVSSTRFPPRSRRPSTSGTNCSWRQSTSRSSVSGQPTTAASRHSVATSSRSTARRTSHATWRCRRSRTGSRAFSSPPHNWRASSPTPEAAGLTGRGTAAAQRFAGRPRAAQIR
jgi:methionine synthase II (cobalamin-independent)